MESQETVRKPAPDKVEQQFEIIHNYLAMVKYAVKYEQAVPPDAAGILDRLIDTREKKERFHDPLNPILG